MTGEQLTFEFGVSKGAYFSDDRKYRYCLWRLWDSSKGVALWIGLNGSTADETKDDPTIRRITGFTKAVGMGGFYMLNLFAYATLDPKVLKAQSDPIGRENDVVLARYAEKASLRVAAWGTHGSYLHRDMEVLQLLRGYPLCCLGTTKGGFQPCT